MNFKDWLINIGKSERTANSYSGAVKGVISDWVINNNISNKRLNEIYSYSEVNNIVNRLEDVDIYQQRNSDGNNMYSAALKIFTQFLNDTSTEEIEEDISNVIENTEITATEKSTLINTRIGQGKFRRLLIEHWNGCAITGCRDTNLLIASHIKPWRSSDNNERLDPFNGLLLLPNFDKAFDLGYITFQTHGDIVVSPFLEVPEILGIENSMMLNIGDEHQEYMAFHREVVFRD